MFSTWCTSSRYVASILNQVENNGITATLDYAEQFTDHMKKIMTMLNAQSIDELKQAQIVYGPRLHAWIEQRNLDIK